MSTADHQRAALSPNQLGRAGESVASLLHRRADWIHRRHETVRIADETTLKRKISVDFTLPERLNSYRRHHPIEGLGLPAPVFVLAKAPARLMDFDVVNAGGVSLPLTTSAENRAVSQQALLAMAKTTLANSTLPDGGRVDLSEGVAKKLRNLSLEDAGPAEEIANSLFDAKRLDQMSPDLQLLLDDPRFALWLSTLAHSTIISVWCPEHSCRQIVKISFREPIKHDLPRRAKLGWSPYELAVESSYVEAQSYHFEAVAPHGMRITGAKSASDSGSDETSGFQRRVHLYLPKSEDGGGGLTKLALRVSARGFLRDAWLPAILVSLAIGFALVRAKAIVSNPNSSPSLFLLLPGLIATYLSRPDRHALTSRLLSMARFALMGSAFLAFAAAGSVAFLGAPNPADTDERACHLSIWLGVLLVASLVALGILVTARLRASRSDAIDSRKRTGSFRKAVGGVRKALRGECSFACETELSAEEAYAVLKKVASKAASVSGRLGETQVTEQKPYAFELLRVTQGPGLMRLNATLERRYRGTRISVECRPPGESRFPGRGIRVAVLARRAWIALRNELDDGASSDDR